MGDDELIHFIDADMDLETADTASVAREIAACYAGRGVGAIGGLVSRADGSQEPYNYGPVFALKSHLTALPPLIERVRKSRESLMRYAVWPVPGMKYWPNVLEAPAPAKAYWLHEGNMLIHSRAYKSIRWLRSADAKSRSPGFGNTLGEEGSKDILIPVSKSSITTLTSEARNAESNRLSHCVISYASMD